MGAPFADSGGRYRAGSAHVLSFAAKGEPDIVVEPKIVKFGAVKVGKHRDKTLRIRNEGDAKLQISEIAGLAPPFEIIAPKPPFKVAAGEKVDVLLRFKPTKKGKFSQSIVIKSNDPDEAEVRVKLKGKGKRRR